jgi:cell division protein FtsB
MSTNAEREFRQMKETVEVLSGQRGPGDKKAATNAEIAALRERVVRLEAEIKALKAAMPSG